MMLIVCLVAAGSLFYFFEDPISSRFMPQCIFHRVTGLQCVGCGSQRMAHALLHGDIVGAWHANAFLLLSLPCLLFLIWVDLQRVTRPELYRRVYNVKLCIIVGILLAAWFIIRNILHV